MTEGTAVWWTERNSEDFAGLKARPPGPLRILDANAPLVPSVTKGKVAYPDRNVICVSLPRKLG
jgi:hypothetical protein